MEKGGRGKKINARNKAYFAVQLECRSGRLSFVAWSRRQLPCRYRRCLKVRIL